MDWNDEKVVRAIEDYREKRIATLEELRTVIISITGIEVSIMKLSPHVEGAIHGDVVPEPVNSNAIEQEEEKAECGDDVDQPSTERMNHNNHDSASDDDSTTADLLSSSAIKTKESSGAEAAAVDDGLVLSDLLSKKVVLANGQTVYRINSQRCKAQLGYRGFTYAPVSQTKGTQEIRWRCLNARRGCFASVRTDKNFTRVMLGDNGHGDFCYPDEVNVRLKAATNDIKISAEFWTGSMRDLYNEFTDSLAKTDPQVLSKFPPVDTLINSMHMHRISQVCRKQFLRDKQEAERRERNAVTTRKRKPDKLEDSPKFPETICCECGEALGSQENLISHLQTVHEHTSLKIDSYEFAKREIFLAWLKHVYNCSSFTHKLNQFGTFDDAAYYLCLKDDRAKRPNSTGIHCSAFVKARVGDSGDMQSPVKVEYCLQHFFHESDDSAEEEAKLASFAPSVFLKQWEVHEERRRQFAESLINSGRCQRIQRVAGGAGNRLFSAQNLEESGAAGSSNDDVNAMLPSTSIAKDTSSPLSKDAFNIFKWKRERNQNVPLVASVRQSNSARMVMGSRDLRPDQLQPEPTTAHMVFLSGLITQIDMECDLIQTRSQRLETTEAAERCLQYLAQARAALIEDPGCRRHLPRVSQETSSSAKRIKADISPRQSTSTASRTVLSGSTLPATPRLRVMPPRLRLRPALPKTAPMSLPKTTASNSPPGNSDSTDAPKLSVIKPLTNGSAPTARIPVNTDLVASALRLSGIKDSKMKPQRPTEIVRSVSNQERQCCECDVKHSGPLLMIRCRNCRMIYHKHCSHTCKK